MSGKDKENLQQINKCIDEIMQFYDNNVAICL